MKERGEAEGDTFLAEIANLGFPFSIVNLNCFCLENWSACWTNSLIVVGEVGVAPGSFT